MQSKQSCVSHNLEQGKAGQEEQGWAMQGRAGQLFKDTLKENKSSAIGQMTNLGSCSGAAGVRM